MDATPEPPTPPSGDQITIKPYFVLLIDILGQQRHLQSWRAHKSAQLLQIPPALKQSIKNSAGVIYDLRKDFLNFFESRLRVRQQSALSKINQLLLPHQKYQDRYNDLTQPLLKLSQFSDTFVAYSPAATPQGDFSVGALFLLVGCACLLLPYYWERNVPLRGALVIESAGEFPDIGFYGPALAKAHYLESKVASHPRIVVSEDIWRLVNSPRPETTDPLALATRDLLRQIGELLGSDCDGKRIIDYLGKGSAQMFSGSLAAAIKSAHTNVNAQAAQHAQALKTNPKNPENKKLADRYAALKCYFDRNIHHWNSKPATEQPTK
ncbi:MAG: hypothetical protein ACP5QA_15125 [Phycisphaerae bacterium]